MRKGWEECGELGGNRGDEEEILTRLELWEQSCLKYDTNLKSHKSPYEENMATVIERKMSLMGSSPVDCP